MPNEKLRAWGEAVDLNVNVLLAPEWKSRQPVLPLDRLAGAGPVFRREYAGFGVEFRARDFASYSARSDSQLGTVPDALVFPRIVSSHYIELVVFFSEPDWRLHS